MQEFPLCFDPILRLLKVFRLFHGPREIYCVNLLSIVCLREIVIVARLAVKV